MTLKYEQLHKTTRHNKSKDLPIFGNNKVNEIPIFFQIKVI